MRCRSQTREGRVPSANVTEAPVGRLKVGERLFVAASDFLAEQEGDLGLARGQLVLATEPIDESWSRGRCFETGASGAFPPSYCWELDASNYISAEKAKKARVEKFAKVVHSMRKQLPEEIDLEEGDIVKIVEIVDKDWYRYGESERADFARISPPRKIIIMRKRGGGSRRE